MKYLVLLLALPLVLSAQEFAPETVANHAANFTIVAGSGGGSTVSTVLFTAGQSFKVSTVGPPLADVMSFTFSKTGPNTATLAESAGSLTLTTALTFTSAATATFRTTSNSSTTAQTGAVIFSAIPQPGPPLLNISTRANLGAGQVLNPGFVVGGTVQRRVLIRAVGPTLGTAPFNVPGSMADPTLFVFRGTTQIATNNDWGGAAALIGVFASVGAFPLPVSSLDAALVLTLTPGSYTAQVRGTGPGEVIVEVYFVD